MHTRLYHILICCLIAGSLASVGFCVLGRRERLIAAYATSLHGRTASQIANARRAAQAMDGTVILPGKQFSFTKATGPWTVDRGYRKAPVSYDGELVRSFGGGVCQTSSTLYCAALAAGLQIIERHRHTWPAKYVPPGGDAAVAPHGIDLRLANPYPFAVRLSAIVQGEKLVCGVGELRRPQDPPGAHRNLPTFTVQHQATDVVPAPEVTRADASLPRGCRKIIKQGQPGYCVRTTRVRSQHGEPARTELIADDAYPPLSRVVLLGSR